MTKYIYAFDEGQNQWDLLGGKGANLSEMKRLGLPVPDGFTITTTKMYWVFKTREVIIYWHQNRINWSLGFIFREPEKSSLLIRIYCLFL